MAVLVLGISGDLYLPQDLEDRVQSELARLLPSWRVALGEIPDEVAAAPPVVPVETWLGDHLEELTPEVVLHTPGVPSGVLHRTAPSAPEGGPQARTGFDLYEHLTVFHVTPPKPTARERIDMALSMAIGEAGCGLMTIVHLDDRDVHLPRSMGEWTPTDAQFETLRTHNEGRCPFCRRPLPARLEEVGPEERYGRTSETPLPIPAPGPGRWPEVTSGGDFEPYVDHVVDLDGARDPEVVTPKTVIAFGTVQGVAWSLTALATDESDDWPMGGPSGQLFLGTHGEFGGNAFGLHSMPRTPTDMSLGSFRIGPISGFDGIVTNGVGQVVFTFEDGETRRADLIPGPPGVEARYFVLFVPQGIGASVEARSAEGAVLRSIQTFAP